MFKNILLFYQKGRDVVPQLFKCDTLQIAHTTLNIFKVYFNINSIYNDDHLQKVNAWERMSKLFWYCVYIMQRSCRCNATSTLCKITWWSADSMISSPYMFMTWGRVKKQVKLGQKHAQFSIQTLLFDNHLIIEPVLICKGRQVVQRQCVFLVRQPEGGERFLFELCQISGNFGQDGVFPAVGGE